MQQLQQVDTAMDLAKLEEAKKQSVKEKMELVDEVMEILLAVAKKRSHSREQEKDFVQEGIVCALEMFDRYGDKPMNELILMTGKAIFRRICSNQRKIKTFEDRHVFRNADFEIDEKKQDDWDYETANFVKVLKTKLSSVEKRILQEKIEPSDDVMSIMLQGKAKKQERKEDGFLVMNLDSEVITNSHIAKVLRISNATVSRSVKRIQEEAEHLMCDRFRMIHKPNDGERKY